MSGMALEHNSKLLQEQLEEEVADLIEGGELRDDERALLKAIPRDEVAGYLLARTMDRLRKKDRLVSWEDMVPEHLDELRDFCSDMYIRLKW